MNLVINIWKYSTRKHDNHFDLVNYQILQILKLFDLRFWFQSKSSPIDLFIVYWSKDWLVYVHVDFRINYMSMIYETIYYLDFYPIFPKYEILSLRRKKESIKLVYEKVKKQLLTRHKSFKACITSKGKPNPVNSTK